MIVANLSSSKKAFLQLKVKSKHDGFHHTRIVAIIRREDRYILMSGSEDSRVLSFKGFVGHIFIPENRFILVRKLEGVYKDCEVVDIGNECGRDVLFIPRIVRKPIVRKWDDMDEKSINDSGLLTFPMIAKNKPTPKTHLCVELIDLDN